MAGVGLLKWKVGSNIVSDGNWDGWGSDGYVGYKREFYVRRERERTSLFEWR